MSPVVRVWLSFAVAACGDETVVLDAAPPPPLPPDLDCVGAPPPTTAPDPFVLQLSMRIDPGGGLNPGVAVELRAIPDDTLLASGTSDSFGAVILSAPSGGHPLAVRVHYTKAMYEGGNMAFPAYTPLVNAMLRPDIATEATMAQRIAALGATRDPAKGAIVFFTRNCAGERRANIHVSLDPSSGIADPGNDKPNTVGAYNFYNLDPGPITIRQTFGGHELTPLEATIYPNEYTFFELRP